MPDSMAQIVRVALEATAGRVEADLAIHGFSKVGERKHLQPAFRQALVEAGARDVHTSEKKLQFRSWEPEGVKGRLGGVDVIVGSAPSHRAFFELKWAYTKRELGWTLWDIYKLAASRIEYDVEAYAVVGAPVAYWDDDSVACSSLFSDGTWDSGELFHRYAAAWADLLAGGAARPRRVPGSISTRLIAANRLGTEPPWELRALAVDVPTLEWLEFVDDWPRSTGL